MLDDRKAAILRAVVEEYIQTAQPVGSGAVSRIPELSVSSATVRNEMGVLEREGYLAQPHTSAGRIPTDKGYRFFVDSIAGPGRLDPAQSQQIRTFFATAHGELERMLADTSRFLSGLTDYAAVVVRQVARPGPDPFRPAGRAWRPRWRWSWPCWPAAPSTSTPSSCPTSPARPSWRRPPPTWPPT